MCLLFNYQLLQIACSYDAGVFYFLFTSPPPMNRWPGVYPLTVPTTHRTIRYTKNRKYAKSPYSLLGGEYNSEGIKKKTCCVNNSDIRRQKVVSPKTSNWLSAMPLLTPERSVLTCVKSRQDSLTRVYRASSISGQFHAVPFLALGHLPPRRALPTKQCLLLGGAREVEARDWQ